MRPYIVVGRCGVVSSTVLAAPGPYVAIVEVNTSLGTRSRPTASSTFSMPVALAS